MECHGPNSFLKRGPFLDFKMTKICWNCPTYGWFDPMIESRSERPLSACKSCKLAMYCSKECQKEHWKKVHKKHCKYLSGAEPSPILAHGAPADCKKCQSKLADEADEVYPCHIQQSFTGSSRKEMLTGVRQCVSLGELTGQFVSKHDKNISILQQMLALLRELYVDAGAGSRTGPFTKLAQCLTNLRITVWYQSLLSKTEEEIDKTSETNFYIMKEYLLFPLLSNIAKCQTFVVEMLVANEDNSLRDLWESFILFFNLFLQANFFYRNMFDLQHISSESFELSEHTLELRDQVFGSNFLTIWDNMLEAAKDKIVPMKELLAIYCDGQLNRTCYICSAEIHVSSFYPFYVVSSDMYGGDQRGVNADEFRISQLFTRDLPCIIFGEKEYFCCGELTSCQPKTAWALVRSQNLTLSTGQELSEKFVLNRCDSCYKVTEGGHRCSNCKMKVYCSGICQNNDWPVHKICCEDLKKSEDKRKKKEHGRRKAGKKRMVKQAEFCESEGTSFHMIDEFSKLMTEKGYEAETEEMEKLMEKLMEDNSSILF